MKMKIHKSNFDVGPDVVHIKMKTPDRPHYKGLSIFASEITTPRDLLTQVVFSKEPTKREFQVGDFFHTIEKRKDRFGIVNIIFWTNQYPKNLQTFFVVKANPLDRFRLKRVLKD